jgi:hypothetical protein
MPEPFVAGSLICAAAAIAGAVIALVIPASRTATTEGRPAY